MIIIHGMDTPPVPRIVSASLADRLRVMPAVGGTGPRQAGESTPVPGAAPGGRRHFSLADPRLMGAGPPEPELAPGERRYFSLDDLDVMDAARREPDILVGGAQPVALDEVQRAPELLHAVKRAIDRRRTPGRFLLTGSANLLLMRQVSE